MLGFVRGGEILRWGRHGEINEWLVAGVGYAVDHARGRAHNVAGPQNLCIAVSLQKLGATFAQ